MYHIVSECENRRFTLEDLQTVMDETVLWLDRLEMDKRYQRGKG